MKTGKTIRMCASAVVIATALAGYYAPLNQKEKKIYDFALENIEALAQSDEGGVVHAHGCYLDKNIESYGSSATSYSICSASTTPGSLYPCGSEKRGKVTPPGFHSDLQCYEKK